MATDQPVHNRPSKSSLPALAHSLAQAAHEDPGALRRQAWLIEGHGVLCLYSDRSGTNAGGSDHEVELAELRHRTAQEGFGVSVYMTYPRFVRPTTVAIVIEAGRDEMWRVVRTMAEIAQQATTIRESHGEGFRGLLRIAGESVVESPAVKHLIKQGHCLELLPAHRIYLRATCGIRKRQRFRVAFREVWDKIPPADRDLISDYWRAGSTVSLGCSPVIEIARGWPGLLWCEMARTDRAGHRIRFQSNRVAASHDADNVRKDIADVIAEQLAHVWQYASLAARGGEVAAGGYPAYLDREGRFDEVAPQLHAEVAGTMSRWGFNPVSVDRRARSGAEVESLEDRLDWISHSAGEGAAFRMRWMTEGSA